VIALVCFQRVRVEISGLLLKLFQIVPHLVGSLSYILDFLTILVHESLTSKYRLYWYNMLNFFIHTLVVELRAIHLKN